MSQLLDLELRCWKPNIIREIYDPPLAKAILSLPIPINPCPDRLIWVPNSNGCFFVKSAYQTSHAPTSTSSPEGINWGKLWKLNMPERTKMLIWRIGVNVLPTRDNLFKRLDISDPSCVICKEEAEDPSHLFFKCLIAKAIWFTAYWGFKVDKANITSAEDITKMVIDPLSSLCQATEQWLVSLCKVVISIYIALALISCQICL